MELFIIIWTIILNLSFVYVWSNKEKLKKWKPVKLKEDKNNEVILGKINGFTIFNFIYILITSKVCFELSRLEVYITRYSELRTLDKIIVFTLENDAFITLFIGLTGMLVAIYIYAVSIDNKLKKFLLLTLIGKEELFYLSFNIVILFFFGSEYIFLVGPIGYLIYLLTNSVKWILKINSESSYEKNFKRVLKDIFMGKSENIKDLYIEIKKSLYKAVKEEELMEIEENTYYFNKLLDKFSIDLKEKVENDSGDSIVRFLYNLHDEAYRNKNDNVFSEISYLHIRIAEYYLKNNDNENFYWALYGVTKVYDYYYRDGTDKFALSVVSGFKFDDFGLYEQYKENFEKGKLWYCQKFRAIIEGIKKTVKNDDLYFFKQFTYLIEQEFEYKEKLKKDYKLLEKSVYFGILLYLREEKNKRVDNRIEYKKINEFIEFIEKRFLGDIDLIDLIELYEFIGEKIYLEFKSVDRLNWAEYFRPKIEPVRGATYDSRVKSEKDKLFFELLGKIGNFQQYKSTLSKAESLKEYLEGDENREKAINRINKFKENASWLLNDLKEYKGKIDIIEESYKEIEGLLIDFKKEIKQNEKEKIIKEDISESKITIFKENLERILSESRIVKWLNFLGKYKEDIKEKNGKTRYIGQYMQKEYFVELGDEGGTKAIAESYGKGQNRAIEQIIIESIEAEKKPINSIEEVLEKIKGKPWIILTGISIFKFFYKSKESIKGNIITKSNLDKKYFDKYGEIVEGIYKYNGLETPIYNFSSDKKGIYILDSNDVEGFIHYDAKEEIEKKKNIGKEFDIKYAHLKITDTNEIIKYEGRKKVLKDGSLKENQIMGEKLKEYIENIKKSEKSFDGNNLEDIIKYEGEKIILNYEILKKYETKKEKLNQFKQLVWITFVQKGELKLKDDAVVYKVEFNG